MRKLGWSDNPTNPKYCKRPEDAMIKVGFFKGKGSWWNFLIRWWTHGPYSHTEIITKEQGPVAKFCLSSHKPDGGVRGKWRNLKAEEWDFVELDFDADEVTKWYTDRQGSGYDLLGLMGLVFRRDDYDRNKYFCSEANLASLGFEQSWRFDPNTMKVVIDRLAAEQKRKL